VTEKQQKEERLAAWDDYRATREKLLALRARFSRWNRPLGDIYSRLFSNPSNAREDDLQNLPSSDEYAAAVREMRQVQAVFVSLRKQAVDFGFTPEPDETLIS
jgi:hypothetical protein